MAARAIYYDTETTGVKPEKDRIIEIAAIDPARGLSFEMFVNPGCSIPPEATAIHGITDEMVANAADFATVGKQFMEFCEGEVVLIAHNNDAFDLPFLRAEYARHGIEFPLNWKFLDSLKWARKFRRDLPRHPLQVLREVYNIPANNAHRALDDVIVLQKVCEAFFDDIPIDVALSLLQENKELQHMPFGKHQGQPLSQLPPSYVRWLAENGALEKQENLQLKSSLEKLGLLKTA